jgi:hypothetical protein
MKRVVTIRVPDGARQLQVTFIGEQVAVGELTSTTGAAYAAIDFQMLQAAFATTAGWPNEAGGLAADHPDNVNRKVLASQLATCLAVPGTNVTTVAALLMAPAIKQGVLNTNFEVTFWHARAVTFIEGLLAEAEI